MSINLKVADKLLEQAARMDERLKDLETQAEAELAPLRQKWEEKLSPLREQRAAADRVILGLCKSARQEFFATADLVDLLHGFLIYGKRRVVRKARGVLTLLIALKWEEAINRTAKVRWEVLDGWPEARLIACGTERMDQETYAYEIKTPKQLSREFFQRGVGRLGGEGWE